MMMKKLIAPILGTVIMAILTGVQEALQDSRVSAQEWVLVALGVLMAFNVWATANLPQYDKMKTYVSAAIVLFGAFHVAMTGGISAGEWTNMAILTISALGVAAIPQPVTTVIEGRTVPANGEVRGTNPTIR